MIRRCGGPEDLVEHGRDVALRRDEAGNLGVRGVRHEQVDALGAEPGPAAEVGHPAVERQLVHLEVAGVQHRPRRGTDRDAQRIRDRVVDREELAREGAELLGDPFADLERVRRDPVLGELALDQRQGQPRADERDVGLLPQQVRHAADVVLVAVREHEGVDVVPAVPQVVEVRQDQVDAGLLGLGEEHPAVDDQQPAAVLEHGHVATDLADPAESDDPEPVIRQRRRCTELQVRVAHRLMSAAAKSARSLAS